MRNGTLHVLIFQLKLTLIDHIILGVSTPICNSAGYLLLCWRSLYSKPWSFLKKTLQFHYGKIIIIMSIDSKSKLLELCRTFFLGLKHPCFHWEHMGWYHIRPSPRFLLSRTTNFLTSLQLSISRAFPNLITSSSIF